LNAFDSFPLSPAIARLKQHWGYGQEIKQRFKRIPSVRFDGVIIEWNGRAIHLPGKNLYRPSPRSTHFLHPLPLLSRCQN
jgi:hypothetical protein